MKYVPRRLRLGQEEMEKNYLKTRDRSAARSVSTVRRSVSLENYDVHFGVPSDTRRFSNVDFDALPLNREFGSLPVIFLKIHED